MSSLPALLPVRRPRKQDRRKLRSLKIVRRVCRIEYQRRVPDFSFEWIGARSQKLGGPSKRTIENPSGAAYQEVIAEIAAEHPMVKKMPVLDEVRPHFASVTSRAEREQLEQLIAERNTLARLLEPLLSAADRTTLDLVRRGGRHGLPYPGEKPALNLVATEWEALAAIASHPLLMKNRWTADPQGRVFDEDGREVLPIGTLSALEKIIALKP